MKEFEIWMEGYAATGERSDATYIGKAKGETFKDACNNFEYPEDIVNEWDGELIVRKGQKLNLDRHRDYPSIWACRLFDNEADARKSFG